MHLELAPFQKRFNRKVEDPRILTCALSGPRGLGKTTYAGWLTARALTPTDSLYAGDGREVCLFSGSIEQCRLVFRAALGFLADRLTEYRQIDSATRVGLVHKVRRVRLRAIGSNPKTSLGLVGVPLVILDEPAALHTVGGEALWDSILTAQGKADSPLKVILIGTLAPAPVGGWWPSLVGRGSVGSTHVELIQGRPDRWNHWREVLRVNPLAKKSPEMRAKLREELNEAKADSRSAARFKSFRLNLPTADESEMLLTVEDFEMITARPVAEREGPPIVGVDLGANRAWSAAIAIWPSGRTEALALAPGIPDIRAQEKRDRVPAGRYADLITAGLLTMADGLHVPPPGMLWQFVVSNWGIPSRVVADRFEPGQLADAVGGAVAIEDRRTRWSESNEDIYALRKLVRDGGLTIPKDSAQLIAASLAVAKVQNESGLTRLVKRGFNNTARDDVAAALVLAAGAHDRAGRVPDFTFTRVAI